MFKNSTFKQALLPTNLSYKQAFARFLLLGLFFGAFVAYTMVSSNEYSGMGTGELAATTIVVGIGWGLFGMWTVFIDKKLKKTRR